MKTGADQHSQAMQRVRVGMIGLAAVILLIGLASAIFSSVNRERAVPVGAVTGTGNVALASNAALPSEPLSELGAAPATDVNAAAPATK
jgi:cobalamin synthase